MRILMGVFPRDEAGEGIVGLVPIMLHPGALVAFVEDPISKIDGIALAA